MERRSLERGAEMTQEPQDTQFCSGTGQRDTRKYDGGTYSTIGWGEINAMANNPPTVNKDDACWFIASSYNASDAREHKSQRLKGMFYVLPGDVDTGNHDGCKISDALNGIFGDGSEHLIFSSRSAVDGNMKWRFLVPLAKPVAGEDYADTQQALFNLLEAKGISCDHALGRPGQPVYLPNRGDLYEHYTSKGPRCHLEDTPIREERTRIRTERKQREAAVQAERDRKAAERAKRAYTNGPSTVDAFNANYSIELLLGRYSYEQNGQDWRSPMQTSGSYATRDFGDHWISLSGSDAAAGLGAKAEGCRYGDAFDLFVHFEQGGDFKAAVKAYGEELITERAKTLGECINGKVAEIVTDAPKVDVARIDAMIGGIVWSGAKSKWMFLNYDGGLVVFLKSDGWQHICRRYGNPTRYRMPSPTWTA